MKRRKCVSHGVSYHFLLGRLPATAPRFAVLVRVAAVSSVSLRYGVPGINTIDFLLYYLRTCVSLPIFRF